jgi:hypothetical protein
VDDNEINVSTAKLTGMKAIAFRNNNQLKREMAQLELI